MTKMKTVVALLLAATAAAASAHVTLEQATAKADTDYKATFMVPHGCDGSPTTSITVQVPDDIELANPQAKPGWTLSVKKVALTAPLSVDGKRASARTSEVTWSGGQLPADRYDEFVLFTKLPDHGGIEHFKVIQQCQTGKNEWTQIPAEGQSAQDLPNPAPGVELFVVKPMNMNMHMGHGDMKDMDGMGNMPEHHH
ncbi:YcnI family copper-binding membrane protein [Andreprevotia chitinilytica]|uniref:YcnI family copper-binding membrane protein n=1 Tax=Andreprevotia chitinilytica TaxID=396808 RepID=UPI0014700C47|nr:YcnI family protein [Andreprevotia chitinilytica]